MKHKPSSKRGVVVLIAVLGISAVLGGLIGPTLRAHASSSSDAQLQDSVKSFTRVLSVVERNYADPVDTDKVIYDGAIPGMLHVLDPHSNFFDPKQYALFKEEQQGKYYGVGMTISQRENQTVVLAPFVGSPAYKAGIRPGDIVLRVEGKSCDGLTGTEVADMLKGPKGTVVHISLGREGWDKPIEVTVTRDEISRPAVEFFTMLKPGIGYVRLVSFSETTDSDVADALKQLDYPKLDGLVFDIRNNGGGLLSQAVALPDMFSYKNEMVVSPRGRSSPERRYYAVRGNQGIGVPLVVLINGQSASASEIVAGAIQDHDRGLVVGENSFGKGLVQTQLPLSEETALLLTTARYYTPSGRLIQRDYKNVSLYDYHYNPQSAKPEITKDFVANDEVINEFRKYLDKQHIKYTEPEIQENLTWLKLQIKREVFTSAFGLNEGFKIALQDDPQLEKAVELIPQSRALYQNARKIVAERQAGQSSHP